jgi:hypothetical protein
MFNLSSQNEFLFVVFVVFVGFIELFSAKGIQLSTHRYFISPMNPILLQTLPFPSNPSPLRPSKPPTPTAPEQFRL